MHKMNKKRDITGFYVKNINRNDIFRVEMLFSLVNYKADAAVENY